VELPHHLTDTAAPLLHAWVAAIGPLPAVVVVIAALLAIWATGRVLSQVMIVIPGFILGVLTGWWCLAHLWHPLLAIFAGLAVSAVIYRIFAGLYFVRLAAAILVAPLAIWTVWHLASGALDLIWALFITITATSTLASLLRVFINSEDHALRSWMMDMRDLVSGD
jgi:hypothetical protein